ncbi:MULTISPECIES: SIMPL domain-containing protein [unclassified Methylobacterium]|uniref:SIMPL domain-containing protein n=1 Tax=unclassified Methylobacterium TaxID=2615210 RepID=UPI001FB8E0C5|nr:MULTISPECIES: SIMPL domain-containing protein [unclassified Methylobacterium]MCJ2006607.1 SIMPL domain-containing protein [Methylobacterium sp. J-092]
MRRLAIALTSGFCLLGSPARADDACARRITVTGRAQATQAPDFATVVIGVEAKAPNAAAALDASSQAVGGVVALAGRLGVPTGDVGTAAVVLEPATRTVTRPDGTRQEQPDGYRATNRVSVQLADLGRLGDLLRQALDTGANRIDAITFGLKDPLAVENRLRVEATRDARSQAQALAEAAGAKIGGLCQLAVGHGQLPDAAQAFRFSAGSRFDAKRVPIEAGLIASQAEATASFAVEP